MNNRPKTISFSDRRGFTLLELLVVIGIVCILAVVGLYAVNSALPKARQAKCLNNMRTIGVAALTYAGENEMKFPLTDNGAWDVPLADYLDGHAGAANAVMKCPADGRPLVVGAGQFARSYSFNHLTPARTVQVTAPADTIMLAEWFTGESGPGGAKRNYQYSGDYGVVEYTLGGLPAHFPKTGYHENLSNFIFADGHAESRVPKTTVLPTSLWVATR